MTLIIKWIKTNLKIRGHLYKNHSSLCALAYNLVGDIDAAKDIVQDTFLKLWNRRQSVTMESGIGNI